jgi:hypothetical protein
MMLRTAMLAAFALALASVSAAAQEQPRDNPATEREAAPARQDDRFVLSRDECGASRYQHLLGREYARVYHAALLPTDSVVQNRAIRRTLEYTPYRLNVVVGGEGRIIAIGCF